MGIVRFGMPQREVLFLKNQLNLNVFVEGGTYTGGTATAAASVFANVFTIEKSNEMYEIAKKNISGIKNIVLLKGDSREHIKNITQNHDGILYWLDAHWSGGATYGKNDECPLIEELEIIFNQNKRCAILIDDARLFLAPPPSPHVMESWPTLKDIIKVMPDNWELIEYEDVIYIIPNEVQLAFRHFLQQKITEKYQAGDRWINIILKRILHKVGIDLC